MDKNDTNKIETNKIETNKMETNKMETNKEIIYYNNEPDIKTIQKIVEGYFTIIPLIDNKLMYVNEEALHDDFSKQTRSWDDSGTIISDT